MSNRTRYKIDAQAELVTLEQRIASTRKSLRATANATTATIELAKLPSLERKALALRAEIENLPERPALGGWCPHADARDIPRWPNGLARATWPGGEYDEALLEIPEALRR